VGHLPSASPHHGSKISEVLETGIMTERSQPNSEVKMDTELKAKWINALRSGEYTQAEGMLHDSENGGYCCLGVLCKVMGAEFGEAIEASDDDEYGPSTYDYVPHIGNKVLGCDEELKDIICKDLGIPDQSQLIMRNDGNEGLGVRKHSFSEIADYIEKNL
jgi:hypothetical protein